MVGSTVCGEARYTRQDSPKTKPSGIEVYHSARHNTYYLKEALQ